MNSMEDLLKSNARSKRYKVKILLRPLINFSCEVKFLKVMTGYSIPFFPQFTLHKNKTKHHTLSIHQVVCVFSYLFLY